MQIICFKIAWRSARQILIYSGLLLFFLNSCGKENAKQQNQNPINLSSSYCGAEPIRYFEVPDTANSYSSSYIKSLSIDYNQINNPNDPLAYYQWHLSSRSQIFVNNVNVGNDGDINVDAVHNGSPPIRGLNVVINVVDTGLEAQHIDLSVNQQYSYNYYTGSNDPSPLAYQYNELNCDDHGTAVAGIIAAKNGNQEGGVGVAPSATLIGHNLLSRYSYSAFKAAMGMPDNLQPTGARHADVINLSFGFDSIDYAGPIQFSYTEVLKSGVLSGRAGKGYIYVKSSGNGYRSSSSDYACIDAMLLDVSCRDVNMDFYFVEPYSIKTAALKHTSTLTSYSTTGASLLISAPGGEYSVDPTTRFIPSENGEDTSFLYEPAILTTDWMGCLLGYSLYPRELSLNDFEYNFSSFFNSQPHSKNNNCNYTSTFNGTSSAAPIISGVVALMLEKNPDLNWRAVKYILANTATQNDASCQHRYVKFNQAQKNYLKGFRTDQDAYMIDQCWFKNAAGMYFSNRYGFGKVNAAAAVNMAGNIANNHYSFEPLQAFGENINNLYLVGQPMNIVGNNIPKLYNLAAKDYNQSINSIYLANYNYTGSSIQKIDAVTIVVDVDTVKPDKILIRLTSPSGTSSIIKHPFTDLKGANNMHYSGHLTNAFFAENPAGSWNLEVYNLDYDAAAFLNHASIIIYGS